MSPSDRNEHYRAVARFFRELGLADGVAGDGRRSRTELITEHLTDAAGRFGDVTRDPSEFKGALSSYDVGFRLGSHAASRLPFSVDPYNGFRCASCDTIVDCTPQAIVAHVRSSTHMERAKAAELGRAS
jgi:hypothetical protein